MTTTLPDNELAPFITGYITCMLWVENDNSNEAGGDPLEDNYSRADLTVESLAAIRSDCVAFITANRPALHIAVAREGYTWERAGHDFWLTRNGHGTGFWDRKELELYGIGEQLSKACKNRGADIYVGDDGKLHYASHKTYSFNRHVQE